MNEYRIKKERERILKSAVLVLSSTTIIFLTLWIIGLLQFEDFNNYSGPVKITFGIEDGIDEVVVPVKEIVKKPEPEVDPEPIKELTPPQDQETPESSPEPEPKSVEPENDPKPKEPVRDSVPEPKEVTPPTPPVQEGFEGGNSHETTFQSDSSDISRSFYSEIYLNMPLPKSITRELFSFITGDITGWGDEGYNRKVFLKFYRDSGDAFVLDDPVDLEDRSELWLILESAGYDIDKADYKIGKKLKPVIISFEISGEKGGRGTIKSAVIDSSSGYKDIDEAVLYGFKKSKYSNSSEDNVKGRFRYSFN